MKVQNVTILKAIALQSKTEDIMGHVTFDGTDIKKWNSVVQ
jgi:hypothetical protein